MSMRQSNRATWPREELTRGVVEYKREKVRGPRESTSYIVSMPTGLLLGRVYSRSRTVGRTWWFAEGWTPQTDGKCLGPFDTRWESFQALWDIEERGRWPSPVLVKRMEAAA